MDGTPAPEDVVAVLYPQTGALRLYQSMALARQHVAPTDMARYSVRSALDLKRSYAHDRLEALWLKLHEHMVWGLPRTALGPPPTDRELTPPDCGTDLLADSLWDLMLRVGDRVTVAAKAQTSSRENYYLDQERISAACADEEYMRRYPKQCRTIVLGLRDLKVEYVQESALKRMMAELVLYGQIKTKQEPWLLFQWYRKQMMDDRLFTRGGTESDDSEESGDQT